MRFTTPEVTAPLPAPARTAVPAAPPFSAGGVIGRSLGVWFRNFLPFSIVTLVVHAPVFVLAAIAPPEAGSGWRLADQLLTGLAGLVATGALAYGVLESLRGGRAGLGTLFAVGFRKLGWVFLTSLGVGLWVLLGTILLVVPGIVWYCALYVAVPAVVVEPGIGASGALARSRELTKGRRWAVLAVVLVVFVVSIATGMLAGGLAATASGLPHPIPALVVTALTALVSSAGACAAAVAYHDLRVAKEGVATADLVKIFE